MKHLIKPFSLSFAALILILATTGFIGPYLISAPYTELVLAGAVVVAAGIFGFAWLGTLAVISLWKAINTINEQISH